MNKELFQSSECHSIINTNRRLAKTYECSIPNDQAQVKTATIRICATGNHSQCLIKSTNARFQDARSKLIKYDIYHKGLEICSNLAYLLLLLSLFERAPLFAPVLLSSPAVGGGGGSLLSSPADGGASGSLLSSPGVGGASGSLLSSPAVGGGGGSLLSSPAVGGGGGSLLSSPAVGGGGGSLLSSPAVGGGGGSLLSSPAVGGGGGSLLSSPAVGGGGGSLLSSPAVGGGGGSLLSSPAVGGGGGSLPLSSSFNASFFFTGKDETSAKVTPRTKQIQNVAFILKFNSLTRESLKK